MKLNRLSWAAGLTNLLVTIFVAVSNYGHSCGDGGSNNDEPPVVEMMDPRGISNRVLQKLFIQTDDGKKKATVEFHISSDNANNAKAWATMTGSVSDNVLTLEYSSDGGNKSEAIAGTYEDRNKNEEYTNTVLLAKESANKHFQLRACGSIKGSKDLEGKTCGAWLPSCRGKNRTECDGITGATDSGNLLVGDLSLSWDSPRKLRLEVGKGKGHAWASLLNARADDSVWIERKRESERMGSKENTNLGFVSLNSNSSNSPRMDTLAFNFLDHFSSNDVKYSLRACGKTKDDPNGTCTRWVKDGEMGPPTRDGWNLIWSDEFDGADGTPLDANKWSLVEGGGGFGNMELEFYTSRLHNSHMQSGPLEVNSLEVKATREDYMGSGYTSARLHTTMMPDRPSYGFQHQYGRYEARIRVPYGQGIWPAFWMQGVTGGTWPNNGEIDIMEITGDNTWRVLGTLHGPGYSGDRAIGTVYGASSSLADAFHIYAIEWDAQSVKWYLDDHSYATKSMADIPSGSMWVFNRPFYLILNVAVGGSLPGPPDSSTPKDSIMYVDYVRVFDRVH